MLKAVRQRKISAAGARIAIVASEYNGRYVNAMLRAARQVLKKNGGADLHVFRVPGAYEVPIVAAKLARVSAEKPGKGFSAIICLGVILRGATVHAAHIGDAVSRALMEIQLRYEVPVIHEVLLLESEDQARARCLSKDHNRGAEAALTALHMARLMPRVRLPGA